MNTQQLSFLGPISDQIKPANGNNKLVEYGVEQDQSDYRAHVGYKVQHVYIFPTASAKALLRSDHNLEEKTATQNGVNGPTAKGFPAPISHLKGIQEVLIPPDIYQRHPIRPTDQTTWKGARAVEIVQAMLRRGLIALPLATTEITDKDMQVKGGDIIISSSLVIQVKCDYLAGPRKLGGTGNLYLQTHECNPRRMY